MNVSSWLKQVKTRIDSLDAELILTDVLQEKDRSFLVAHDDLDIDDKIDELEKKVLRREKGEPLAYILGKKEFFMREFLVSRGVLIPRPESEAIIEMVKGMDVKKILDVGTGSGCIAVSLKLEKPEAEVFGVDVSFEVLEVARKNAKKWQADVKFLQSNLLEGVNGNFDAIVANLPYVDRGWGWIRGVEFEPDLALYAKDEGLDLIKKLIVQAKGRTKYLVLEADPCQHEKIIAFGEDNSFKYQAREGFILKFCYSE